LPLSSNEDTTFISTLDDNSSSSSSEEDFEFPPPIHCEQPSPEPVEMQLLQQQIEVHYKVLKEAEQ